MMRFLKLALIIGVILALNYWGSLLLGELADRMDLLVQRLGILVVLAALLLYVALLSLPFVPGVEIGWAVLMIFGTQGAVMVYVATVLALCISFFLGRRIPFGLIIRFLEWLRFNNARAFYLRIHPLSPEEKVHAIVRNAPARVIPFLVEHRYLAIAVAFNLPGNALIGGGGGIGMLAGMSSLFPFPRYLLTVSLAVAPIPLFILANGGIPLLHD
jgi:hypothetical protein